MESPPKAEDKVNIIGIVAIGLCGALLVYVSVVALQAFYINETSSVEAQRAAAGRQSAYKALNADHLEAIDQYAEVGKPEGAEQDRYAIPIDVAMDLVVEEAQRRSNQNNLIPVAGTSTVATYAPFGRELETPDDGEEAENGDAEDAEDGDGETPADGDADGEQTDDGASPADGAQPAPAEGGGVAPTPVPEGNEPAPQP